MTLKSVHSSLSAALLSVAALLTPALALARDANTSRLPPESVASLMTRDLAGISGKEVLMLTVTYLAGAASMPHRHDAQVFVYVLEGQVTMQLEGSAPVTLRAGQTFYEGPGDIHKVSANASRTDPAKILVFMIKDKDKPTSRAVPARTP